MEEGSSRSSSACELEKELRELEVSGGASMLTAGNTGSLSRRSVVLRTPPARKAKRVRFFRNGDRFYSGVMIPVLAERYRSFDSLTADLTRVLVDNVTLPSGVRSIYSLDGKKIGCLSELEDGGSYVCSGLGETFKRLDYQALSSGRGLTPEGAAPNNRLSRLLGNGVSPLTNGTSPSTPRMHNNQELSHVRPRIVTVIRNGIKPRKVFRLLLNKRNSASFEHVLTAITECVRLDTGCVRRVFTLAAQPVLQLKHFFQEEDVFFAYGNERFSQEDFELEFEESKAIQQYKKSPTLRNGTRSGPAPKMPVKVCKNRIINAKGDATVTEGLVLPQPLLNKFSVGKIIGDGNFAVVRLCRDRLSGEEYALKVIDKAKCRGKEYYVEAEVRIMRRISHPRIVALVAEQDTRDCLYLVIQLVRGGDLFDSITQASKFSEEQARLMIGHLASAMAYLHSISIVHRDIKPENLLVEMEGSCIVGLKLGDFGLACEVDRPLFTVCGTPTYVAPEILLETGYGLKIDVWAAGVILYILLCGFPPFVAADGNQDALFDAILSGHYEFPLPYWEGVSAGARDLITNMLQHAPRLRFSAEDVLDHAWLSDNYPDEQEDTDGSVPDDNGSI